MRKKVDPDQFAQLMDDFEKIVLPWCEENELSLHRAFELSREADPEKYKVLSGLWGTLPGRSYLRSLFRSRGGTLRKGQKSTHKEP